MLTSSRWGAGRDGYYAGPLLSIALGHEEECFFTVQNFQRSVKKNRTSFSLFYYYFTFSTDKESLSFTTPGTAYFLSSAAFMAYVCCSRPHNQVARVETPKIRQMYLGQKSGMSWFYWQFRSDRRLKCQNHVEFWSHVLVSCPLACPFKKQSIEHSYLSDQILH